MQLQWGIGGTMLLGSWLCACDGAFAEQTPPSTQPTLSSGGSANATRVEPPIEGEQSVSPAVVRLRQQPRAHVAASLALVVGPAVASEIAVPLPAVSLDVGAQLRDSFAVFAMTRFSSLLLDNRLRLGAGFEWSPYDSFSLSVGATGLASHGWNFFGPDTWRFGFSLPLALHFDVPIPPRTHVVREGFRLSFECYPTIEPTRRNGALSIAGGFGLGYSRR